MLEPWYKVVTLRKEVREGRSFDPDEFAVRLEQVVNNKGPDDYRKPEQFFSRTVFTRALRDHAGMVLRRLSGETRNAPPILSLITQFGGGKTHTLTALYHLVNNGKDAAKYQGVPDLLNEIGLNEVPKAKVAVFVGNAWDPQDGKETPWIDIARQLAGQQGVDALGPKAKESPPGTEALDRLVELAGGPVLLLFDEVLNALTRHKELAEPMHAFIHNVMRGFAGTTNRAAVVSLPRSPVEMTDWDIKWQEKILKIVGAVASQLIVNDEAEVSKVIRCRLIEELGDEKIRNLVAKTYANWCFERRTQLPTEWTAVDTATTEARAKDILRSHFENCYPFHPATLSVFQRKWQALPQYQQTRGTIAMLAHWLSIASKEAFVKARKEPLIMLGSAPLFDSMFKSSVLGQLGEHKLSIAIDTDLVGDHSHARALDADTSGPLREIHRRVGTAILFESSGGQTEKVAHLPELRFALGELDIDTTSIDTAASTLEGKAYFIRPIGTDGYRIGHQPRIKKVVNDRRASLDEETEIKPAMRKLVEDEFKRGASVSPHFFPEDSTEVEDKPKLALWVLDPDEEWADRGGIRDRIAEWTKKRGESSRLYPAALVWCVKKQGRELREKVELWLAWGRVAKDIAQGVLGGEFDPAEKMEVQAQVKIAEQEARGEVWSSYRFTILYDNNEPDKLRCIDLGAGHSSSGETLCGRVISSLKAESLLNESIGAGYLERSWPVALKESGEWPLSGLRQSFLDGSLTRLLDPDTILRQKIVEFVLNGDFGLAYGNKNDGKYERVWFRELLPTDEVTFDHGMFLITRIKAESFKAALMFPPTTALGTEPTHTQEPLCSGIAILEPVTALDIVKETETATAAGTKILRISGTIPLEVWNRLGTKILPKLKSGLEFKVGVEFSVTVTAAVAKRFDSEIRQILEDLGLSGTIQVE